MKKSGSRGWDTCSRNFGRWRTGLTLRDKEKMIVQGFRRRSRPKDSGMLKTWQLNGSSRWTPDITSGRNKWDPLAYIREVQLGLGYGISESRNRITFYFLVLRDSLYLAIQLVLWLSYSIKLARFYPLLFVYAFLFQVYIS